MGIDAVNYQNNQFLGLTRPVYNGGERVAYHQGRVDTNPYENRSVFSNIEELEARKAGGSNSVTQLKQTSLSSKGAAWEGFSIPANNGTGELRPKIDNEICIA